MYVYQLVHQVHEKYKGICRRLAENTSKMQSWWYSHGYAPKDIDPNMHGNPSEVDAFVDYCTEYENAARGSGRYLADLVANEMHRRFGEHEHCAQRELRNNLLQECSQALLALDHKEFDECTTDELRAIDREVSDVMSKAAIASAHIRKEIIRKDHRP